ncbi:anaerobic selenocysteine-containing dehydrogenase [Natronocella acetinitrilica]|uniref:Anaerobic selenocysteine-containing dehydrogenase n=1 Tax=Natronocella acetinitrilica TaxID=414046 RepID=A0AAE3G3T6_9GAMM|nr:molybdopterin oxidoreductase family protein [Natronocella acetinitrilica]MCP1675286.1 anaerobic selenocysteine-containing dehydrogenase [Natronocella acetinitrilica]
MPAFENHAGQQKRYTTCYMCACRCGIEVTVEHNQVRFIKGNPNHPINKGVLCAKGNAGIMKQLSPAKLTRPLMRKPGTERGAGEFVEVSWEEALDTLTERLRKIRATDPKKLAFFTGRDQMQALTGLWAQQFGTINWAAHGGFCSVNMAAAGLYTIGHSFWEFGDPDWDRARYFLLWGVAEDHASNPIKLGIDKLKQRGGKFVAINPVRTGYQAVADEWVAIRPGTDAMLALSMCHVLLSRDLVDWAYLGRYTNAPFLVIDHPGHADDGMIARDEGGHPLVWDRTAGSTVDGMTPGADAALFGEFTLPDGRRCRTVMMHIAEKYLDEQYAPARAAEICGVSAETIERLALEMAHVAFRETIEIECEWTDWAGRKHDRFIGRPVAMHAMRGISAHSNGFQTCRALHLLQVLLGTVDVPGGHLAKPPFPRHTPPPIKPARSTAPDTPLSAPPLGFPTAPEDLVIDAAGRPLRIDKAYSWEAPIANHGLMHMVITNAVNGDPYPIDTLILFMANMAWNSTMNTGSVQDMLRAKHDDGEYKLPFLVVVDAFHSETVNFADLVLPDTTYLERHDVISLLDRPISEPDAVCDAIRAPVLEVDRDVRPWQEVLVELAGRLGFPAFVDDQGQAKYSGYTDFITRWEKAPGIGFLGGFRGEDGEAALRGEPNPDQWQRYIDNQCFYRHELPPHMRFYRFANQDYLRWAKEVGFNPVDTPIVMELYSETLQRFRQAGRGLYDGPLPPEGVDRQRLVEYFDPLPCYYMPLEEQGIDRGRYPFHAVNQRPMHMYHSWDSQNTWLRQITAQNRLFMNRGRAAEIGIEDDAWVWVESHNGRIRVQVSLMEGCEPNTVWTWNAIGKQAGAWGLDPRAPEATRGFLMNHLISELLPSAADQRRLTNSDPITGQAAWYDLRVSIAPCSAEEAGTTWPNFPTLQPLPGTKPAPDQLRYTTHEPVRLHRKLLDILMRKAP